MTPQQDSDLLAPGQLAAWRSFLEAHTRISRSLESDLVERHGLTLSEYDVLVQLAESPERRLRNIELANAVLLTRSGVTRVVQRLERAGLAERVSCEDDRRGSYVRLTDAGLAKLREAAGTHLRGVRARFAAPLDEPELRTLGELLARISSAVE